MGRRTFVLQNAPGKLLEWDSDFFGVRIARVDDGRLDAEKIESIFQWCAENKIDCLYFLCAPDDDDSVAIAENAGFHQVDIRMELFCRVSEQPVTARLTIRNFREGDLPFLKEIAANVYRESRFYYDRNFDKERVSALYQEWIQKSCRENADAVLVAQHQGNIGGFISCQADSPNLGRIGLLGVSENARGIGVGNALVKSALNYFCKHNVAEARVVTQGRNISAQRLYQANGFRTHSLNLWYHKWLR
jgi:dTDP-4-amino-4,6-dideoxy-D-galactose acyltransferase